LFGEGNSYFFKYRLEDSRIGRFYSIDPLSNKFPWNSSYAFSENKIIAFGELEGLECYYAVDGTFLGQIGENSQVRIVKDNKVKKVTEMIGYANASLAPPNEMASNCNTLSKSLGITNEQLISFAAVIHNESGGDKEESYAIGNVTMNFLKEGGSSQLKNLEDVTMYDNTFAQGATQENYSSFKNLTSKQKNSKFAVGAAINAVGKYNNIKNFGFKDYSGGADSWDGIDLVDTDFSNSHRKYTWDDKSKSLLLDYKNKVNGGIDVSKWKYKTKNFDIKATKIIGKTLFTNLQGGRGERKQEQSKFK
jgi:hypothetical protein